MPTEPDSQTEQLDPSAAGGTADYRPTPAPSPMPGDTADVPPPGAASGVEDATGDWRPPAADDPTQATGAWQPGATPTDGTADFTPSQSGATSPITIDVPGTGGGPGHLSGAPGTQQPHHGATAAAAAGASPPAAPQMRSGRYVLRKFHAKGGMGEIWLAEDDDIGRSVALKKMRGHPRPDQKDQFLREAQITGQLEHPGVVPIHELGVDDAGQPFYVMKFIQGRTLTDALDEYHAAPAAGAAPREVQGLRLLQTFLSLCQTVAYAHSRGVIHRDIKPDNVMVGAFGETLVLDWGLAKPLGVPEEEVAAGPSVQVRYRFSGESLETMDGAVKGTPAYMAPEVAEGDVAAVDQASDIYLLGGTLYHILTGKKPREARKIAELIEMARKKPATPPRKLDPRIPRALEAICLKALAARKEDRYATAAALADDVQRYLAGEPVSAYRETFWERAWRWVKRHRVLLGRSAAALLVLGLVLFGLNELRLAEEQREADRKVAAEKLQAEQGRRRQAQEDAAREKRITQARKDAEAFRPLAADAQRLFALQNAGAEQLVAFDAGRTERQAEEAVARLGPWGRDLAKLPLEAERPALKQQLYETLLILAETLTRRGTRREAARDALAFLDRAAALREPTAAHRRLEADCHGLLGEEAKAAEARQRAAAPGTPVLPFDHLVAGERLRAEHARAVEGREKQSWTREQEQLLERAADEYRQAIKSDYKDFWAHHQLGQCYLTLRKEDLAYNEADTCVALRSDSPWGYTLRGNLRAFLHRPGQSRVKELDDARADLEQAMKLAPELREPRLQRGVVNWLSKRYDEAVADFDAVLLPPAEQRLIEAAFYRGQVRLEQGEVDRALADFNLVLAERPFGHPAALRRARIHFARGDFKRGLEDLNALLNRGPGFDPESYAAYAERGRRMRVMVGELPRPLRGKFLALTLAQLEKAVAGKTRSAAVYDELGAVREMLGKVPAAIEAYTEAVKLSPKEARLLVKRAWAHEKREQYAEAAADFAAALKLDPSYAEAHAGLGYIQACRGQAVANASSRAAEAVLLNGGDYLLLHNVASVYGKLSERDPPRAREFQDMALVYLRREVELWRRDRSGPDPRPLIRGDPAFPPALQQRPEFQKLFEEAP